jgi:hypothetical protein
MLAIAPLKGDLCTAFYYDVHLSLPGAVTRFLSRFPTERVHILLQDLL